MYDTKIFLMYKLKHIIWILFKTAMAIPLTHHIKSLLQFINLLGFNLSTRWQVGVRKSRQVTLYLIPQIKYDFQEKEREKNPQKLNDCCIKLFITTS